MSQPIVAAIQMTSVADVARNLDAVRRLIARAREGGACLAVLPENFSFMGRNEAERRAIVISPGTSTRSRLRTASYCFRSPRSRSRSSCGMASRAST